ncbi:MAG: SDR family NAD(P)-dependent oxidoreductase [Propionibacterium sp.]|nr:SDR family NAD(P)-dependent oxidoreductase [Propionibacterium sp.]
MGDNNIIDADRYGPWAVIAGGSEGVGAEMAVQLAEAGINSVLVARKPEPLEATAERVRAAGAEARTISLDLTAEDAVARVREQTDDLDVGLFIYNAGANTYGHEFATCDLDAFQPLINLNVGAMLRFTRHFSELLAERGRGGIMLVGSMSGYVGMAKIAVYSAVKAFVRLFAEGLWMEMREKGVDVVEFVLGLTRTPAMERAGLNLDGPNVNEPDDMAREGLANLANGPVYVASTCQAQIEHLSGTDRAAIVEQFNAGAAAMHPEDN